MYLYLKAIQDELVVDCDQLQSGEERVALISFLSSANQPYGSLLQPSQENSSTGSSMSQDKLYFVPDVGVENVLIGHHQVLLCYQFLQEKQHPRQMIEKPCLAWSSLVSFESADKLQEIYTAVIGRRGEAQNPYQSLSLVPVQLHYLHRYLGDSHSSLSVHC